jgi:hypothetical protein
MPIPSVTQQSASSEKIAFFRSLFKGREDLYPQRFESRKTGKAGYSPACGNEGGFGNLIALPLQKKARDLGNSVFVNDDLIAYEDQYS